jgi:hypothetical protein
LLTAWPAEGRVPTTKLVTLWSSSGLERISQNRKDIAAIGSFVAKRD